ncbi:hypothetical protein BVRB_014070 [Beta vulgaris subsp. vulgaris]|uniref:Uncharacterized protein n=1 Tax=Beta vulgaris subsp. vulgaris TaxID=3555 RepID=A0A0J8B1M3_BETVV|nr:hypothetical protein BVRB_014070 [Beta vulgaris subsp. vulgaris]
MLVIWWALIQFIHLNALKNENEKEEEMVKERKCGSTVDYCHYSIKLGNQAWTVGLGVERRFRFWL